MNAIPPKSRMRYLAHNPSGELAKIITPEIKKLTKKVCKAVGNLS